MGPGHRLGNEASDCNRQVPSQRQGKSGKQTEGELTTVADRPVPDGRPHISVWREAAVVEATGAW